MTRVALAFLKGEKNVAIVLLTIFVCGCSAYANTSFLITNKADFEYFPPFKTKFNANKNRSVGGGVEYLNIAKSIVAGEGFANPFPSGKTGPTAWMPPVLPAFLAGLFWACENNRDYVMIVIILLQNGVLIVTGMLAVALVQQSNNRISPIATVLVFASALLCDFNLWFQRNSDYWLILFALDLLIFGLSYQPLESWRKAACWGFFGALFAMINPVVGLCWAVLSISVSKRDGHWRQFGVALVFTVLALLPWTIRNYLVLGRLIPVKSNLAFELYQSQCLQTDGLLRNFADHPNQSAGPEFQEYMVLGEMAFLDRKMEQFRDSVWENPMDFATRLAYRFVGATLWYVPFNRGDLVSRPGVVWVLRMAHSVPFLALLVLVATHRQIPLSWFQWSLIVVYLVYLVPYIVISYYERYAAPLLGVKTMLILCAIDRVYLVLVNRNRPSEGSTAS